MLGDTEGYAHTAAGVAGYFDNAGKYSFKRADDHPDARWRELVYEWPAERDRLADEQLSVADAHDLYVCACLMRGRTRAKGAAVARTVVHSDVDNGQLDLDRVAALSGFAIGSGTPGNGHVYVAVTEHLSITEYDALCRALGRYLGAQDSKISDNDFLRPPGTFNHKTRARGGQSTPVEWLIRPTDVKWEPAELAAMLGTVLPPPYQTSGQPHTKAGAATGPNTATGQGHGADSSESTPFDLDAHPQVIRALHDVTGDRSEDTYRVVAAVHGAGLTLEHARWAVDQRADLAERLAERDDDDVLTCWEMIAAHKLPEFGDSDGGAGAGGGGGGGGGDGNAAGGAPIANDQFKDAYVSQRIADEYLSGYVHNGAFGWRRWDGRRWAVVDDGVVLDAVRRAVIKIHTTAALGGAGVIWLQAISALLSASRINGILRLCAGIRTVEAGRFDQHRDMLNCANGVVDLRTKKLMPHDPNLWFTTLTPTDWEDGFTHKDWTTALSALNAEEADYLQVRLGQAITGHLPDDDKVLLLQGGGSNGKTCIMDGVVYAVGDDHAVTVPDKVLAARPDDHPTELMTLRGARLAFIEGPRSCSVCGLRYVSRNSIRSSRRQVPQSVSTTNGRRFEVIINVCVGRQATLSLAHSRAVMVPVPATVLSRFSLSVTPRCSSWHIYRNPSRTRPSGNATGFARYEVRKARQNKPSWRLRREQYLERPSHADRVRSGQSQSRMSGLVGQA